METQSNSQPPDHSVVEFIPKNKGKVVSYTLVSIFLWLIVFLMAAMVVVGLTGLLLAVLDWVF